MSVFNIALAILIFIFAQTVWGQYKIYIDADFTNNKESSNSIQLGVQTALDFKKFTFQGKKIKVIPLDHRGNYLRSKRNIKSYLKDDKALVMFTGLHSPPLLKNRDFINKNKVVTLDPWAAAAPITRYPNKENYIFRLSIDDSKAGKFISQFAVTKRGIKNPLLVLERTGWGKSNERNMTTALKGLGIKKFDVEWFDWNLKEYGAKRIIQKAVQGGHDGIFLVANNLEGVTLTKSMISLGKKYTLPIFSHWGITGGNFHELIPHSERSKIDLVFIQTKFSFLNDQLTPFQKKVFDLVKELNPSKIKTATDLKAPTGFIHGFDLTLLLINALKEVKLGDIKKVRVDIKNNLEDIKGKIQGLIKEYEKPFKPFSPSNQDYHEALEENDYSMAKFGPQNEIILLNE